MLVTLEIDCDPFAPRPDEYAKEIFKNILHSDYQPPRSVCFGCWTWENVECTREQKDLIGEYLTGLYGMGRIRYASW